MRRHCKAEARLVLKTGARSGPTQDSTGGGPSSLALVSPPAQRGQEGAKKTATAAAGSPAPSTVLHRLVPTIPVPCRAATRGQPRPPAGQGQKPCRGNHHLWGSACRCHHNPLTAPPACRAEQAAPVGGMLRYFAAPLGPRSPLHTMPTAQKRRGEAVKPPPPCRNLLLPPGDRTGVKAKVKGGVGEQGGFWGKESSNTTCAQHTATLLTDIP